MAKNPLTKKQRDILHMRYERGATISQIAVWLDITRRAVFYRLRNARRRSAAASLPLPRLGAGRTSSNRKRLYVASQISSEVAREELNMDEL